MGWIAMIVIGLLAGLIAKAIMPGKDPGGVIVTILLGIIGALIGGGIRNVLNIGGRGDNISDPGFFMTLIFAVLGALVVLVVYRLFTGRSLRA
ncbi:MAG TPA: GlsB/YeaQ/YmgE family stress response membrane protein [Pyrinomonadaceae bacterium]|nr:GlsB/YeaQ/YmgE family stress response membrane protein [Pyrinomonadaceae bacterium]